MDFLKELNDRQKEAAETLNGPLLIVAGAGSGKTRTLTYRIANIIAQGLAEPWQILAVTFTNKAAGEMKGRISTLLQKTMQFDEHNQPMIGTFHSVCLRILRRNFDRFGREKSFVIYDTDDCASLVKRIIKELHIEDDKLKPKAVLAKISHQKNKLVDAETYAAHAGSGTESRLAEIYTRYEKRLIESNAVDFDDLLIYTVKLFKENPDVLDYYQERWRFINVDEYQDTNFVQYTLVQLLASKYRNLCVIGDSDQSIYSFRGADISNILDFEKDYSDAKIVKLEQNYRSTQNILSAANAVIEKNEDRKAKEMWTKHPEGDAIEVWHLNSEYDEVERVAKEIEKLRTVGATLNDIVILYRTNAQSRLMEEALLRFAMPYRVIGGVKFYSRKEIKDILAYLRIILNPNDSESLLRIINVPSRKIGQTTINKLQNFALERTLSLGEVLKHAEMVSELSSGAKAALVKFYSMLEKWRNASEEVVVADLIREIIKDVNYKEYLLDGTEQGEMRHENVLELISVATKYDELQPVESLRSFLEEVALVQDTDNLNQGDELLTMMTLHSAKGLEFPYVFIIGCEESIFPHSRTFFDKEQLEEERRLMYVGMTRAMKRLYLCAARQRTLYGDKQMNAVSRFIHDIPKDIVSQEGAPPKSSLGPLDPMAYIKEESHIADKKYTDGQKVRHGVFGEGTIIETRGDLVTVAFKDPLYGIKKFASSIAPLEEIE